MFQLLTMGIYHSSKKCIKMEPTSQVLMRVYELCKLIYIYIYKIFRIVNGYKMLSTVSNILRTQIVYYI